MGWPARYLPDACYFVSGAVKGYCDAAGIDIDTGYMLYLLPGGALFNGIRGCIEKAGDEGFYRSSSRMRDMAESGQAGEFAEEYVSSVGGNPMHQLGKGTFTQAMLAGAEIPAGYLTGRLLFTIKETLF